ncbi:hypothetical protein LTR08_004556 [Meristemomyces frigidus]|nr:hypothetical protein LTR08_004556 [Meristemomyces frigidus]
MSAAAGAPPPPSGPPGGLSNAPPDKNDDNNDGDDTTPWPNNKAHNKHNNWLLNIKIKTGKCRLCEGRIKKHSWKCSYCGQHVCSECGEEGGTSGERHKYVARSWLATKCGCAYPSGQAPTLQRELEERGLVSLPEKRVELFIKDKKIKADVKRRKEEKAQAEAKEQGMKGPPQPNASAESEMGGDSFNKQPETGGDKPKKQPAAAPPVVPSASTAGTSGGYAVDNPYSYPTITSGNNLKRKDYDEFDEETPRQLVPKKIPRPGKRARQSVPRFPCAHLENGETVIIGAGVAGMFIALELSIKAAQSKTPHTITIVEIMENHSQQASGSCAGLLTSHGLPGTFDELFGAAETWWKEAIHTVRGFVDEVDFCEESVYAVARLDGNGGEHRPSWYAGNHLDTFVADSWSVGKIKSQKLTAWLYAQCKRFGVIFHFNHVVEKVIQGDDEDVSAVKIKHSIDRDQAPQTLRCQNLIFAAGPWTTEIFNKLFVGSTVKVDNNVSIPYWARLEVPSMPDKDNIGLIFPDITGGVESLEDRITMVAQATEDCMTITGVSAPSRITHLRPADALEPQSGDTKAVRPLKSIVRKRLTAEGQAALDKAYVGENYNFVSTSEKQLPIVDKIPTSRLRGLKVPSQKDDARPCGVWMCFGFGMNGTTLAPGAARVLGRRIFGEASEMEEGYLGIYSLDAY